MPLSLPSGKFPIYDQGRRVSLGYRDTVILTVSPVSSTILTLLPYQVIGLKVTALREGVVETPVGTLAGEISEGFRKLKGAADRGDPPPWQVEDQIFEGLEELEAPFWEPRLRPLLSAP